MQINSSISQTVVNISTSSKMLSPNQELQNRGEKRRGRRNKKLEKVLLEMRFCWSCMQNGTEEPKNCLRFSSSRRPLEKGETEKKTKKANTEMQIINTYIIKFLSCNQIMPTYYEYNTNERV